ncbi:hypothetical protein CerSpe_192070 [Prunus speciosa]
MLLQPKLNHFLNEIDFLSGFGGGFQALCIRPHLDSHSTDTCRRRLELLLFWRSEDRFGGGWGGCNQIGSGTLLNQLKNQIIYVCSLVQAICKKVWKGNPIATTMKNVSRGLAALTVPFTMSFPKRAKAKMSI